MKTYVLIIGVMLFSAQTVFSEKISELETLEQAEENDLLIINDVSDGVSGKTKNIALDSLFQYIGRPVTLESGGTGASLSDPDKNAVLQWDDSNGTIGFSDELSVNADGTVRTTDDLYVGDNIFGGANDGRMDIGWSGAGGGNFEIYSSDHSTRPGDFRVTYGGGNDIGDVIFSHYDGASAWDTVFSIDETGGISNPTHGTTTEPANMVIDAATGLMSRSMAQAYFVSGNDVALADGGTGTSLASPANNGVMFYNTAAGAVQFSDELYIDAGGSVGVGETLPGNYGRFAAMTPTTNYGVFSIDDSESGGGGVNLSSYYLNNKTAYIDFHLLNGTPNDEDAEINFGTVKDGALAEHMKIDASGQVYFSNASTTASAANVYIDSSTGQVLRSTSSIDGKNVLETISVPKALADIRKLEPVFYTSKLPFDDPNVVYAGLIAEWTDAAGVPYLVVYDADGKPGAIAYDRVGVVVAAVIPGLVERLERIESILGITDDATAVSVDP